MAENRMQVMAEDKPKGSLFDRLEQSVKVDLSFEKGLPIKLLPRLLFAAFLTVVYIGNTHYADRSIRTIDRLEVEVEDLKADYQTLKADLMVASKQSEVARRVADLGLEENDEPPTKILVQQK